MTLVRQLRGWGRSAALIGIGAFALVTVMAPAAHAAGGAAAVPGPVVVVGVPDLRWQDVEPTETPALWRLAGSSSVAAMTDQSGEGDARRAAGWLTFNTGSRARADVDPRTVPDPAVPAQLSALQAANRGAAYRSQVGALGDALHRAGLPVATVGGPGAVLGAMTGDGTVDHRDASVDAALRHADVVVVELPQLYAVDRQDAGAVHTALTAVDAGVAAALRALPENASLLVAGVSDGLSGRAHLHVALATGPAFGAGRLTSASTGRDGVVQLIDVAPTVLWLTGSPVPPGMLGQHWSTVGDGTAAATRVSALVDLDRRSQAQITAQSWYYPAVAGVALAYVVAVVATWAWRRARLPLVVSTVVASVPVAGWPAQLLPWWRAGTWPLALLTVGFAVLLGSVAAFSPWARRGRWRPAGLVGAVTAAVLVVDAGTGSPLSLDAPFGDNPIIAGRFHGLGNIAFALLGAGTLVLAAAVAAHLRAGRAAAVVFGLGAAAVAVDGHPGLGDDFGGILALLPAVAVLGLTLSRVRIAVRHALAAVAVTVGTAAGFALYDYSRPPADRTHLGRFVGQLVDGSAGSVVARKLSSSLGTFTSGWPRWIALCWVVLAVAAWYDLRHGRLRLPPADDRHAAGGLAAALVVLAVLGAALNDSGLAVTAFTLYVGAPLLAAMIEPVPEGPPPRPALRHPEIGARAG
ncbi:MAG: hypothetical protein ACXVX8_09100 [Blastococcus sp.]